MCFEELIPLTTSTKTSIEIFLALDVAPAIATILGNSLFLLTLIRTASLHRPSNVLLGALCISDLMVGFIARPLFILSLVRRLMEDIMSTDLKTVSELSFYLCCGFSFNLAIQITIDRYVAICHPFTYRQLATCKKYIVSCILSLFVWVIFISFRANEHLKNLMSHNRIVICIISCCVVIILMCYTRIIIVMLKQRTTVLSIGTIDGQVVRALQHQKKERAKTYMIVLVIGFFLLSYIPMVVFLVYLAAIQGGCHRDNGLFVAHTWTNFLVLFNSCINPIIYCAKCTEIRHACKRLLKNLH